MNDEFRILPGVHALMSWVCTLIATRMVWVWVEREMTEEPFVMLIALREVLLLPEFVGVYFAAVPLSGNPNGCTVFNNNQTENAN